MRFDVAHRSCLADDCPLSDSHNADASYLARLTDLSLFAWPLDNAKLYASFSGQCMPGVEPSVNTSACKSFGAQAYDLLIARRAAIRPTFC